NNGLLLGFWISLIFYFLGRSPRFTISLSLFFMLAWQSRWNLLMIPYVILEPFLQAAREMKWRISERDWAGWDFGSMPFLIAVLWFGIALFFQNRIFRRLLSPDRRYALILMLAFVVEPIAIWLGATLVPWSPDASWWKV